MGEFVSPVCVFLLRGRACCILEPCYRNCTVLNIPCKYIETKAVTSKLNATLTLNIKPSSSSTYQHVSLPFLLHLLQMQPLQS